jgi:flagellar hook-length control protein FliK
MSAISVYSHDNTPSAANTAATGANAASSSAAGAGFANAASSPFVALLSGLMGSDGGFGASAAGELPAEGELGDALSADSANTDQLLTPLLQPVPLRQDFGAAILKAAGSLTDASINELADALAKPGISTLNNTTDMLAAAKASVTLAPALSAMKDALLQADHVMNLSVQGVAASALASSSPTSAVSTIVSASSPWTVPGHALRDNTAWSSAMTDRLTWLGQNGITSASLHITPEDLGPIHVRIQMSEAGAKVAFSADHRETQALIERMLPKLNAAFEAQGLRLDDVRVQSGAAQAAQLDLNHQQHDGRQGAAQQALQAQVDLHTFAEQGGDDDSSVTAQTRATANNDESTKIASTNKTQLDAYA